MTAWEYLAISPTVVAAEEGDPRDALNFLVGNPHRKVVCQVDQGAHSVQFPLTELMLKFNEFGAQGWELCASFTGPAGTSFLFKRPVVKVPLP